MPRQFKTARKMCKLKLLEAAEKLGVSQPTLSSWEAGRKSPTIDSVLKMAELYKVSTDFLLGNITNGSVRLNGSEKSDIQIPHTNLRIMHGQPVWTTEYGWMIVDSINMQLLAPDNVVVPFEEAKEIYYKAPEYSEGAVPKTQPIESFELREYDRVWVEPISTDSHLRSKLRGWYSIKCDWVENSAGCRFSYDTYTVQWLAFSEI